MNRNSTLILCAIFCFSVIQAMIMLLAPLEAVSFGAKSAQIGLLVAIPSLLGLLADVPAAVLSNQLGRRPLMIAAGVCALGSAVVLALSREFVLLGIGMMLFGLGTSGFSGPALTYVTEAATPENHARVQGYNGGVQGMGIFLGATLAGILADQIGFSLTFLSVALFVICALVFVLLLAETVTHPVNKIVPGEIIVGYRRIAVLIAGSVSLKMACLIVVVYGMVFWAVGSIFFPIYLVTFAGYTATIAGLVLGVRNLIATITSPFFGRAVARFGLFRSMLVSNLVGALPLFLIPWSTNLGLIVGLFGLQGAGFGFTPGGANLYTTAGTDSSERALGFAITGLTSRVSLLLFPPLLGIVADLTQLSLVFFVGGSIACLALVAFWWLNQQRRLSPGLALEVHLRADD